MRKFFSPFILVLAVTWSVQASWYWPFSSRDENGYAPPRISELMEKATSLIDEAADLAADGKVSESIEKYREALNELDFVERENPDRAKSAEFATLRNKRAYVNAAIDSMLMGQIRSNAKAVAVSDTTELERRLAEERSGKKVERKPDGPKPAPPPVSAKTDRPRSLTKREQAMAAITAGDFKTAEKLIAGFLSEKPNSAMALNLKAAMEIRQGRVKDAGETLDRAIMSNPRNHFAYYNMANLLLQSDSKGNVAAAKRYYETGRAVGGPVDEKLEAALK